MCIPRDAFVHPKKKAQKHTDRKATFCASRKNLFSKHEEISEGPLNTVSRHSLNTVLTLSCMRERDTRTDRQTDRETDLSKLQIGDAFLSLCA